MIGNETNTTIITTTNNNNNNKNKPKSFTFILIPFDESKPIQEIEFEYPETQIGGDLLPLHLKSFLDEDVYQIEATPLKRMSPPPKQYQKSQCCDDEHLFLDASGVYAYHCLNSDTNPKYANIRATSLSMACGLLSQRFYGDVFLSRLGYFQSYHDSNNDIIMMNTSIMLNEIKYATYVSPDVRRSIVETLLGQRHRQRKNENNENNDEEREREKVVFPDWILEATRSNYEDAAALSFLAETMNRQNHQNEDESSINNINITDNNYDTIVGDDKTDVSTNKSNVETKQSLKSETKSSVKTVVVQTSLCLHCRRPSKYLCPNCEGMYFCESPRSCQQDGWSHQCLCETWKLYTQRRSELSTFPFTWHTELMSRQCQLSDHSYESYLEDKLGILLHDDTSGGTESWWKTEKSGWKGGESDSAKEIRLLNRLSYEEGFKLDEKLLPPERKVTAVECTNFTRDLETNFISLKSWSEYYSLRGIPLESPVALLCTFPLTLYHSVQEYGKVPIVVSKMLHRPMRIHVVGVEKELNFLDIFKEFGFLLPEDVDVELVFICREDMVPKQCKDDLISNERGLKIDLTSNLTLYVQPGTFADTLDPLFDCGTGPPDMIIAFNAGLYAYKSWRSVVQFLSENKGVVGVFTDYNEHSGMNCASLGGGKSRESLKVNPFRQPRAMPVYSMNLPQFSNGFIYVFNEQELDM